MYKDMHCIFSFLIFPILKWVVVLTISFTLTIQLLSLNHCKQNRHMLQERGYTSIEVGCTLQHCTASRMCIYVIECACPFVGTHVWSNHTSCATRRRARSSGAYGRKNAPGAYEQR